MDPFVKLTGVVAPLNRANVDTDQIIPKQFLKRIERRGFGQFLFFDWRFLEDGSENPEFDLNKQSYKSASILVSGRNFGCGSSREHAPWALLDYGIKCVIAPSFADIFFNNCFQNGILPIVLPENIVEDIIDNAENNPGSSITVDLESQTVIGEGGLEVSFDIQPFRRYLMLNGLDDIGLTLEHEELINTFESARNEHGGVVGIKEGL